MKQHKGFTLIELIIVIVILGILAVTAAPRFFDFSTDARVSTLGGLKASVQGAMQIEYAKTAITGAPAYPVAGAIAAAAGVDASEWDIATTSNATSELARIAPKGLTGNAASATNHATITVCYVQYDASSATAEIAPELTTVITGC